MTTNLSTLNPQPSTALSDYRAAHPQVREAQDRIARELKEKLPAYREGLPELFQKTIAKGEEARFIGILFVELSDTLAGKRITLDFYEQMQQLGLLPELDGRVIRFEHIEWFTRYARKHVEKPIDSVPAALESAQLMLSCAGEEFALVAETQKRPPVEHAPANPLSEFKAFFRGAELTKTLEQLRSNPGFCPNGRLRPDLCEALRVELAPELKRFDEAREFVRAELGV